eukprot:403353413
MSSTPAINYLKKSFALALFAVLASKGLQIQPAHEGIDLQAIQEQRDKQNKFTRDFLKMCEQNQIIVQYKEIEKLKAIHYGHDPYVKHFDYFIQEAKTV